MRGSGGRGPLLEGVGGSQYQDPNLPNQAVALPPNSVLCIGCIGCWHQTVYFNCIAMQTILHWLHWLLPPNSVLCVGCIGRYHRQSTSIALQCTLNCILVTLVALPPNTFRFDCIEIHTVAMHCFATFWCTLHCICLNAVKHVVFSCIGALLTMELGRLHSWARCKDTVASLKDL